MIVEIAGLDQLTRPVIEGSNARATLDRFGIGCGDASIDVHGRKRRSPAIAICAPDGRALFEIPFEIDPPEYFRDELVGSIRAVLAQHGIYHFGFAEQTGVEPGRKLRDIPARPIIGYAIVVVSAVGVVAPCARQEFGKAIEPGAACRSPFHIADNCPADLQFLHPQEQCRSGTFE